MAPHIPPASFSPSHETSTPPPSPPATAVPPGAALRNIRNTPAQARKKAARASTSPVNGGTADAGSLDKPKQHKSRNGCATCKAKRLKCDERKPTCQQCERGNRECGGYSKVFQWKNFDETNVKANVVRHKRGPTPRRASEVSFKQTTPTSGMPSYKRTSSVRSSADIQSLESNVTEAGDLPFETLLEQSPSAQAADLLAMSDSRFDDSPLHMHQTHLGETVHLPPLTVSMPPVDASGHDFHGHFFHGHFFHGHFFHGHFFHGHNFQPGALCQFTPGLGLPPTVVKNLWPFSIEDPLHQDFVNFELHQSFQIGGLGLVSPTSSNGFDQSMDSDDSDFVVRGRDLSLWAPATVTAEYVAQNGPNPRDSQYHRSSNATGLLCDRILVTKESMVMFTARFDQFTCGILSIMNGPNENPWRELVWPMALRSPALYHAINAMVAFHSSQDFPELELVGTVHQSASMHYVQEGIQNKSFYTTHDAIATALALGFAETWALHTNTGTTHIKGAQAFVKQALEEHRQNPKTGVELAQLKFLCNAWVYMDVMARLTSFNSNDSNDFDNFLFSDKITDRSRTVMGKVRPGFGIDFGIPVDCRLDPLMGCASTLFPLIGRLANLVRKICRTEENSPSIITEACHIKNALEKWEPPKQIEIPEDPATSLEHVRSTAEAYRWATLLHLHSAVPELPSESSFELGQRALNHLAVIPLESRTVIIQMYPLMLAGCEAVSEEDRGWVRQRWAEMYRCVRLGNMPKALTVVEEVWQRRDAWESAPAAKRTTVLTSKCNPQRQPLPESDPSTSGDSKLGAPGRSGVVYTIVQVADATTTKRHNLQNGANRYGNGIVPERRGCRDVAKIDTDRAYSVRGPLHWVGVMWHWKWEILLG